MGIIIMRKILVIISSCVLFLTPPLMGAAADTLPDSGLWVFQRNGAGRGAPYESLAGGNRYNAYKFIFPASGKTGAGDYVEISRNIKIPHPLDRLLLRFWVSDGPGEDVYMSGARPSVFGKMKKELYVDGQLCWEDGMSEDSSWQEVVVRLKKITAASGEMNIKFKVIALNPVEGISWQAGWGGIELAGAGENFSIGLPEETAPAGEIQDDIVNVLKRVSGKRIAVSGDRAGDFIRILESAGLKADTHLNLNFDEGLFDYDLICLARYYRRTGQGERECLEKFLSGGKAILVTEGTPLYLAGGSSLDLISGWLGAKRYGIFTSSVRVSKPHFITGGMNEIDYYFPSANSACLIGPLTGTPLLVGAADKNQIALMINRYKGSRVAFLWEINEQLALRTVFWLLTGGIFWSEGTVLLEDEIFSGGYDHSFHKGESCTWVYGMRTGYNTIKAEFSITEPVSGEPILTVSGLDDDGTGACKIEISVNGEAVFSGANDFSEENWEERNYQLKPGILRHGVNEIIIKNLEDAESTGAPPWFMLNYCKVRLQK